VAKKVGKYKVGKQEYEYIRLQQEGGNIGGDLNIGGDTSIEGDIDVLNTISGSAGSFLIPGDLNFITQNGEEVNHILTTTGEGSNLGIYNNIIYIDGTNVGIGKSEGISGKLDVNCTNNIVLSSLPTSDPSLVGALWASGSTAGDDTSKFLVVSQG
tara:strand:+ start:243 stop:710 length:468 start_codon:yes stop_codon:yes gene_type:complete